MMKEFMEKILNIIHSNNSCHQHDVMDRTLKLVTWNV